jgi:hypothetical protein
VPTWLSSILICLSAEPLVQILGVGAERLPRSHQQLGARASGFGLQTRQPAVIADTHTALMLTEYARDRGRFEESAPCHFSPRRWQVPVLIADGGHWCSFPTTEWPPSFAKLLGEPVAQGEEVASRGPKPMQPVPLRTDPLGLATIGQVEREAHQPQVMVKNRGQLVSQARGKSSSRSSSRSLR